MPRLVHGATRHTLRRPSPAATHAIESEAVGKHAVRRLSSRAVVARVGRAVDADKLEDKNGSSYPIVSHADVSEMLLRDDDHMSWVELSQVEEGDDQVIVRNDGRQHPPRHHLANRR
jgi:hypothetical protein